MTTQPTPPTTRTVTADDKSFPAALVGRDVADLDAPLAEFSTPLFVLDREAMDHNLATMAAWTRERGLELMPHGKTTMAPTLWHRQLAAGATGITVATPWQAGVALRAGIPTVQIANMSLDPGQLRQLAAHLSDHPEQEVVCWADSFAAVELMERSLPADARIGVLVELGADGGRTGARHEDEAVAIAERIAASPVLTMRGVAGYEGALAHDRSPESLATVGAYCRRLAALVEQVRPLVEGTPWATAGGSAYFDLVAEAFAGLQDVRAILRSGAYIVHDSGFYRGISPLDATRGVTAEEALRPAMRAYARVVSQPEPGLALLDAGKRDVPFDEGLPTVLAVADELGGPERAVKPGALEVTALNDQHTFVRWDAAGAAGADGTEGADGAEEAEGTALLAVGQVVTLGLSHPCTAFDKWRLVPVVDGKGVVVEAIETRF
ncbi:alanine racemase [Brachybacterium halotolerans subsp. kimchii]|uniref:alanine racemase n=1 Tax=Brachybacterium halotolerans TaxID=2795215 RepID=UPI001E4A0702|nr:alanine racemase [Brachybacterium halotolerans]UEJ81866.1 alanine racemase [Brachybacterium halotolerans subsp. kimchii]